MADQRRVNAAVIGASGYTGGETVRLLADHPEVRLTFLSAERHAGSTVGAVHPWLRNHPTAGKLKLEPLEAMPDVDVAFACLPTGALPKLLPQVAARAAVVLNLAGDFRLHDRAEARRHYPDSEIADQRFAYFVPELSTDLGAERFVNLPGCMAVASIYALYPLFCDNLVEPRVVVDAKTGSSGSGKGGGEHPAERAGNFRVHKPHGHRHAPEIRQALAEFTGFEPELQFSSHSLDLPRGIMVSCYSQLREGVSALDVKRAYASAYAGKPFVKVRTAPRRPQDFPMLKAVIGSNLAEVAVSVQGTEAVSVAALDNLVKGAAGQAVQTMNLMMGIDEATGLPTTAVGP
ncbi:N-acetyl-gamma-glutamyl-phosphate reductase [Glycomyces sp. TRM65418]|uniref:N-acetyl-gamma-glutamyl-phosphate reductase n=1 Tax=Glycomyces sp. TRM65418 TaxID=2867006 RepID=UPI001CE4F292|nr:N-acetyl-gamma-glutamyl-phosphate reductase [Glycomyces sp. TRM65418]MCC3763470.1 N-acetyl-gamma-glutamyl-phosphate reductase [Glycomyces sp. TRM65418]QZD57457.1 N-acetyl-gamma-glutamyl-phosphate reductase [Glycomyces sp. TRM65418]